MHRTFKRIVAVLLAAASIATPTRAWASGPCSTYGQVASHATGGDWVGGLLVYQSVGTVTRHADGSSTSSSSTSGGSVDIPEIGGASGSSTSTTVMTQTGTTTTTQEPVGIYAMNDGSMYEINCITGESTRV